MQLKHDLSGLRSDRLPRAGPSLSITVASSGHVHSFQVSKTKPKVDGDRGPFGHISDNTGSISSHIF